MLRQHGSWVWGVEADAQWSGQDGSTNFTCPVPALGGACNVITGGPGVGVAPTAAFNQKLAWFVTGRGRLGLLVQSGMAGCMAPAASPSAASRPTA